MTFELLNRLIEENDIPRNVKLMSDSGWECCATDMNGVWYNREKNTIVFTQVGNEYDYSYDDNWELIHGKSRGHENDL